MNESIYNADQRRTIILNRLRHYKSMVNDYKACCEIYDMLFPSGTGSISDMPRNRSDVFEPERWAERRLNQRDLMAKSLDAMREEYENIEQVINMLTGNYKTVLIRRYVLGESNELTAERMACHRNTVQNWHDAAIRKLVLNCADEKL